MMISAMNTSMMTFRITVRKMATQKALWTSTLVARDWNSLGWTWISSLLVKKTTIRVVIKMSCKIKITRTMAMINTMRRAKESLRSSRSLDLRTNPSVKIVKQKSQSSSKSTMTKKITMSTESSQTRILKMLRIGASLISINWSHKKKTVKTARDCKLLNFKIKLQRLSF